MKCKKFEKKLVLNKETIADLKTEEMKDAAGGMTGPYCFTWLLTCGPNSCNLDICYTLDTAPGIICQCEQS